MPADQPKSFWGHLEVLRWVIIRILLVTAALAVVIFLCKETVFTRIVMAPCRGDFATYRLLCRMAEWTGVASLCPSLQQVSVININLAAQLMVHISTSCCLAILAAFPYIVAEGWHFLRPALYERERRILLRGCVACTLLFFAGVVLSYFLIFPLTLNFLGNYQVSPDVVNQLSLNSYISSLIGLTLSTGAVFEMPVAAYCLARTGVLTYAMLARARKVAVVVCLILAAIITPSTDVFTLMVVALPVYLLYELSLLVVRRAEATKE